MNEQTYGDEKYNKFVSKDCPKCKSVHTIFDDWCTVCAGCGFVLEEASYDYDFNNFCNWGNYTEKVHSKGDIMSVDKKSKKNINSCKKITWREYTSCYYTEIINMFCDNVQTDSQNLPEDILEAIHSSLDLVEYKKYRDDFIQNPCQRTTQRILRKVQAPEYLSQIYRSRKTREPLVWYHRKNFIIKWRHLMCYLAERYEIEYKSPYLPHDIAFVLSKIHDCFSSYFHNLMRNTEIEFRRTALPSKKVYTVTILLLINPDLFDEYENLIGLPKINTTAKNVLLCNRMVNFVYPLGYMGLRTIICNITEEWYPVTNMFPVSKYLYLYDSENDVFSSDPEKTYRNKLICLQQKYPLSKPTSKAILIHNLYDQIYGNRQAGGINQNIQEITGKHNI